MRQRTRLVGGFFLVLGLAGLVMGLTVLAGADFTANGTSCKAVCGLAMLTEAVFGEAAARLVGGWLWVLIGVSFAYFGWRTARD